MRLAIFLRYLCQCCCVRKKGRVDQPLREIVIDRPEDDGADKFERLADDLIQKNELRVEHAEITMRDMLLKCDVALIPSMTLYAMLDYTYMISYKTDKGVRMYRYVIRDSHIQKMDEKDKPTVGERGMHPTPSKLIEKHKGRRWHPTTNVAILQFMDGITYMGRVVTAQELRRAQIEALRNDEFVPVLVQYRE